MARIVCISDTHSKHHKINLPDGDILIHAGDISSYGTEKEVRKFDNWLADLPHPHKIVVAGNHDFVFEREPDIAKELITHATYLEDSGTVLEEFNLKIWGSPITPWFFDFAFNRQRGEEIDAYWQKIPEETDILITHGPPHGILDDTVRGDHVGCEALRKRVDKIRPRVHIFGHIHEAYGAYYNQHTWFVNAAIMDISYKPINPPLVLNWD